MADFDFNNFLSQLNTQGGGSSQIDFSSLLNQWQSNQGGSNNTGGTGGTGSTTGIPSYTGGGDVNKGISWFQGWAPGQLADWTNTTNDAVKQALENNQLALDQYQTKMNEMVDLFNQFGGNLNSALTNSLGGLQDAENYFSNVSGQAIGNYRNVLDQLGQSVMSGQVAPEYKAMLDQMRQNQYDQIQKELKNTAYGYSRDIFQNLGAKGMMDSTRATDALGAVNRNYLSSLEDASRVLENNYLQAMLEQPYKMYQTLQPTEASFLSAILGNAADITKQKRDTAGFNFSGAQNMFNSMMEGGKMLSELPRAYQDMANLAPQWAEDQQNNFLASLIRIWEAKLNEQLQRDDMNERYDDSIGWGDVIGWLF